MVCGASVRATAAEKDSVASAVEVAESTFVFAALSPPILVTVATLGDLDPCCEVLLPSNASRRLVGLPSLLLPGDRAKISGCDRAREAFVGDWYDARLAVDLMDRGVCPPASKGATTEASGATDVVGDVLRLFAGEASMLELYLGQVLCVATLISNFDL